MSPGNQSSCHHSRNFSPSMPSVDFVFCNILPSYKVWVFWEGHKIWKNLHRTFDKSVVFCARNSVLVKKSTKIFKNKFGQVVLYKLYVIPASKKVFLNFCKCIKVEIVFTLKNCTRSSISIIKTDVLLLAMYSNLPNNRVGPFNCVGCIFLRN